MTKIEALEKTIYNLENGVYGYWWASCDSCNCGILARTIMNGITASEAGFWFLNRSGVGFSGVINDGIEHCKKTGTPLPLVFKSLQDCGFTYAELNGLESCGQSKESVIEYMKVWVRVLKESESVPPVKEPRVNVIYVAQTLKESVPVLSDN